MTAEQLRNISEMGIIPPQTVIQMQQSTLPPSSSQVTAMLYSNLSLNWNKSEQRYMMNEYNIRVSK